MSKAVLGPVVIASGSMYRGKGIVIRWVGRVTRSFGRSARELAPVRSGELKRGIFVGTPRNAGAKRVQGTISSHAPHTFYVLRGTNTPIMSTAAWAAGGVGQIEYLYETKNGRTYAKPVPGMMMAVGRRPHPPVTPKMWVRGQQANNFLEKAWVVTAGKHPGLPAFPLNI